MAVDPGAQERREVRPVPVGEAAQPGGELELGLWLGEVERRRPQGAWDVLEQLVDRRETECREHLLAIGGRVRTVWHRVGQPAAISAS